MDCPFIRDIDVVNSTTPIFYYSVSGVRPTGWKAATIFRSEDDLNYSSIGISNTEIIWGNVTNALGGTQFPFRTDFTNTLTLFLANENTYSLSSISDAEFYNGGNLAILMDSQGGNLEIINFKNAVQNANSSYTLDTLLRGRRGTEGAVNSHTKFDIFMLLTLDAMRIFKTPLSSLNIDSFFKAVSNGQSINQVATTTRKLLGNSLKPYAPGSFTATLSGADINLSWKRRTRLGSVDLPDYYEVMPLSEDTEAYDLVIYNNAGTAIIRTISNLSTSTYTYTAADQTADGFTLGETITAEIYQVSAQVGRGFNNKQTLFINGA